MPDRCRSVSVALSIEGTEPVMIRFAALVATGQTSGPHKWWNTCTGLPFNMEIAMSQASVLTLTDDSQMSSDLRIWADEENRTNFDRRR